MVYFCIFCSNIIEEPSSVIGTRLGLVHQECFSCCVCSCSLFGDFYEVRNNKYYCQTHFLTEVTSQCYGCGQRIKSVEEYLISYHKAFHPRCFNCDLCMSTLLTQAHCKTGRLFHCYICSDKAQNRLLEDNFEAMQIHHKSTSSE